MALFGVGARWLHVLGATLVVGVVVCLVAVARPAVRRAGAEAGERFAGLDRRLLRLGGGALLVALAAGLIDLWRQTSLATGLGLGESLAPAPVRAVLLDTRYGTTWLVRHGLLVLTGALLLLRGTERDSRDWLALRLEAALLGGASLGILALAGHAAAGPEWPAAAIAADVAHVLATGVWVGGLLPLALLLGWTATLPAPAAATVVAGAARRFSALGLAAVLVLVVTGTYTAWEQVGGIAPLVGTPYGRWLLVKLGLLLLLLVLAASNRLVLTPRLLRAAGGDSPSGDPGATARLRRQVLGEALLGLAILAVVAVLGLTTPARHATVAWPFDFRLSWDATRSLPGVQTRVAIGSQVAVFGLVAALVAAIVRRRRWAWLTGAGIAAVGIGLWTALPPLAVDAYPTTYLRPTVPYAAASIVNGQALYRTHCAVCHGTGGHGDGPAAAGLRPRPADLTARHAADHTVGDLFWWLTHGIKNSAMQGFGDRLGEDERWDLINFLRTLAAAEQARVLAPVVDSRLGFVAPDFSYTTGVGEERNLKDHRGERLVLLVFFTLPGSAERLGQLAAAASALSRLGAVVLGVPTRAPGDVYRALGARPVFFPIAVDGAADAAGAYRLFRLDLSPESDGPAPPALEHMELLVDRQGYLRARWVPGGGEGWGDPGRLLAEVERLAREPARSPIADEHVH
jgi:putative copper resistance protein D